MRQTSTPLEGHTRLNSNNITYLKFYNNGMKYKVAKTKLSEVSSIQITKWKRVKHKRIKHFTKFFFFPKTAIATLKNGKKVKLSSKSIELFSKIYLFLNNGDTIKVFANFSLYYNRKTLKFYGTNKKLGYHVKHPPKNVLKTISLKNYYRDNSPNRITENTNPSMQSPGGTLQMRRSESQIYFERLKKERLRRQQEEMQRERERRRAERQRQEQRNRETNSRNRRRRRTRTNNR